MLRPTEHLSWLAAEFVAGPLVGRSAIAFASASLGCCVHVTSYSDSSRRGTSVESRLGIRRGRKGRLPGCLRWLLSLVAVFAALVAWKRDVLLLPPYEDQAVGLWAEADFLAETGFDYRKLIEEEPHYMSGRGGARSYVISVLPTMLAVLMRSVPSTQDLILATHLFTLLVAALILQATCRALSAAIGLWPAVLVAAAMVTTPLFGVQIEMVGMEIPLTLVALLAAVLLWREHYVAAAAVSLLAFLFKATGALLSLAGTVYLAALLLLGAGGLPSASRRKQRWGLLAHVAVLVAQLAVVRHWDTSVGTRVQVDWPEALRLPYAIYWCPDVVLLVVLSALLLAVVVGRAWSQSGGDVSNATLRWRCYQILSSRSQLFISALVVAGMIAANSQYIFIPRYFTMAIPFVFLLLGGCLFAELGLRRVGVAGCVVLMALNLYNADGRLLPEINEVARSSFATRPWFHARQCALTERSREYLHDQRATMEAARRLERGYADHPIFATVPHLFYLTKPRLGYVAQRLDVYNAADYHVAVPAFVEVLQADVNGPSPVFVWAGSARLTLPSFDPATDFEVYRDDEAPPLQIYAKPVAEQIRRSPERLADWYLDHSWPGRWPYLRLESRLVYYAETGDTSRVVPEVIDTLVEQPQRREFTDFLVELAQRRGMSAGMDIPGIQRRAPAFGAALLTVLDDSPRDTSGLQPAQGDRRDQNDDLFDAVAESLRSQQLQQALQHLAEIVDAESASEEVRSIARCALAALVLQQGDLDAGERWLGGMDHDDAGFPEAPLYMGIIRLQQGQIEAAVEYFHNALQSEPGFARARGYLGIALAKQGAMAAAREHLQHAWERSPRAWSLLLNLRSTHLFERSESPAKSATTARPS